MVKVEDARCGTCGGCVGVCPFLALTLAQNRLVVDEDACTDCGACISACPTGALALEMTGRPCAPPLARSYDVVVVGAGPGGSIAALAAARARRDRWIR